MSDAERWSRSLGYPVGLTIVWGVCVAVFFRYWELTLRAPGVLVWVLVCSALYVATAVIRFGPAVRGEVARVWRPLSIWLGIVLVVGVAHLVVPYVRVGNQEVATAVFVNTLDVLFPCWLLARGVLLVWDAAAVRVAILVLGPVVALMAIFAYMVPMPGRSHEGPPPTLDEAGTALRDRLRTHVQTLAGEIGERSESAYEGLVASVDYLRATLDSMGFAVDVQEFEVGGQRFQNLAVELPGGDTPEEIVIVGGHYDTAPDTPGANDNASGTAAVLELARMLRGEPLPRTVRFVLFPNEEPPFFATEWMGSYQYAARSAERGEHVVAMLSMETIGYFSDETGSQQYPPLFRWFYPSRGDFIGFVGNLASRSLVHRCIARFRGTTPLPSEGVAAMSQIPGVGWSDHLSFWEHGYRALMITDTAPFRYDHYHMPTDTPDKLDYDRMTWVVLGTADVIRDLAGVSEPSSE